jgi:glycosyltransferase involved in cell wall biosynthesis
MVINIISNLNNAVGLQRDFELLREELTARGHRVQGLQFNKPAPQIADVNVFLEVVNPFFFQFAQEQWAVPNPEWWFTDWSGYSWHRILAKTRDCERIFKGIVGDKCQYIGWKARDLMDLTVERQPIFLHVCGKSHFKNTQAVIPAAHAEGVSLTLVGAHSGAHWVDEQALRFLMNSCLFHVMPSAYEGYGHVLHEALGVGAIVITTDAPPMNDLVADAILVPSTRMHAHHSGLLHYVEPEAVQVAMQQALHLSAEERAERSHHARQQFEQDNALFSQHLDDLFGARL